MLKKHRTSVRICAVLLLCNAYTHNRLKAVQKIKQKFAHMIFAPVLSVVSIRHCGFVGAEASARDISQE